MLLLGKMPEGDGNAVWDLFNGVPAKVASGAAHYRGHSLAAGALMSRLFERYRLEGIPMPLTIEDLMPDARREILDGTPPEERLQGLSPEWILAYLKRLEQRDRPGSKH